MYCACLHPSLSRPFQRYDGYWPGAYYSILYRVEAAAEGVAGVALQRAQALPRCHVPQPEREIV